MATDRSNDVRAFRDFLDAKLSQEAANLTLEEALVLWEIETQPALEREATVQALRNALADLRAEDTGIPLCQVQAGARRNDDRTGRPRVPASSSVRAEILSAVRPSRCALRGSRWLD